MENFENLLDEDVQRHERKRPTFLSVLCILTFIGSGFGIISALVGFTGMNDVESTLSNARMGSDPFSQGILDDLDIAGMQSIQNWANILSLLASALCLSGALVMWRLKKFGFILYVAGHVATIFGSYIALGLMQKMGEIMPLQAMGGLMETMGVAVMVITVFISIGFIIMYGVNLKAMNK